MNKLARAAKGVLVAALIILLLLGVSLAFDSRFLPVSALRNNLAFAIFVYLPTLAFAGIALWQLLRRRLWPAAAFTVGLAGTGVWHQLVADASYGNPGYMVPTGHMMAPAVSMVAYCLAFIVAWLIVKASR